MSSEQPLPGFDPPSLHAYAQVGRMRTLRQYKPEDTCRTPRGMFLELDQEFGFRLDACALPENCQVDRFYSPAENGLIQPWIDPTWCNPPYSDIAPWVIKARREQATGVTSVLLLPVRSDLAWWHDHALAASEIRFIRGRVWFEGRKNHAPFPSCLLIFRGEPDGSE